MNRIIANDHQWKDLKLSENEQFVILSLLIARRQKELNLEKQEYLGRLSNVRTIVVFWQSAQDMKPKNPIKDLEIS